MTRLFCGALALTGFAGVTGTDAIAADVFTAKTAGCTQGDSAGYYLPKKLLHVRVTARSARRSMSVDPGQTVADRGSMFCLGLLDSPPAPDLVVAVVQREGLLEGLTISDRPLPSRTGRLATLSAAAAAAAVAGRGNLGAGGAGRVVVDLAFDPFDAKEAAAANRSLRVSGFCVLIEGHTVPAGVAPSSWCQNPQPYPAQKRARAGSARGSPPPALSGRSVLYRPNIAYNLVVMKKAGPRSNARWVVDRQQPIAMPNISPPIAVDIDPSLFAKRTTYLEFTDGVLTNISVGRLSEGTVAIPLSVARGIVSIPNRVLSIGNDPDQNRDALIRAQTQLIQEQQRQLRQQPEP